MTHRSAIGFNCTEEENTLAVAALRRRAWQALRAKIDEQTADAVILGKLRAHFEERFRYDENGVPRVWKPEDDIDGAFKVAKDEVRILCSILLFAKSVCTDSGSDACVLQHQTTGPIVGVYLTC